MGGYGDLCKYLIAIDADPQAIDSQGKTPMDYANESGHVQILSTFQSSAVTGCTAVLEQAPMSEDSIIKLGVGEKHVFQRRNNESIGYVFKLDKVAGQGEDLISIDVTETPAPPNEQP